MIEGQEMSSSSSESEHEDDSRNKSAAMDTDQQNVTVPSKLPPAPKIQVHILPAERNYHMTLIYYFIIIWQQQMYSQFTIHPYPGFEICGISQYLRLPKISVILVTGVL